MASGCFRRWRRESAYLRFIHGFLQSAPQLILQSVIVLKGIHIHSLHQTVDAIQKALQSGGNTEEGGITVLDSLSYLMQDKPLRWYWGLIQVSLHPCTHKKRPFNTRISLIGFGILFIWLVLSLTIRAP